MAGLSGGAVRLAPGIKQIDDIVGLTNGRFALAGLDTGGQDTLIWWFTVTGSMIGSPQVLDESDAQQSWRCELSAGDGLNVLSARLMRPLEFDGTNPVVVQKLKPGTSGPEREALDGTEVHQTTAPSLESWGDGHALVQASDGPRTLDWGIELLRLDARGRTTSSTSLSTDKFYPIKATDQAETAGGGLAIVADYYNTSTGIWLWTLDAAGSETSGQRIDRFGAYSGVTGTPSREADIEVLARGDILVAWDSGPLVARRFDEKGNALGTEFTISDGPNASEVQLLALDDGGFMATWLESTIHPVQNTPSWAVKLREFDATGNAVGAVRTVTKMAETASDPVLVSDGGDGANLIWLNSNWDGLGDSRDFVPHAVLRGVTSDWISGATREGTSGHDTMKGGFRDNLMLGKAGRDTLFGQGGDDDLRGGSGADKLRGGTGRDLLEGGRGNDNLSGMGGADIIVGGLGNDTLRGGGGGDQFVFRDNTGADVIKDFNPDMDVILLEGELFGGVSTAGKPLISEHGGNTIIAYTDLDATITLEGVTGLAYDINFLSGPILIY